MKYLFLVAAVLSETIGTSALQASNQFTKFWPSVIVVISYALAFYFLSITLKYITVGIAYALWVGLRIIFITIVGLVVFGRKLDSAAIIGLTMIILGIAVIHLFSTTSSH